MVAKKNGMKKLLCFVCFGLLMLTATAAPPTREVEQVQSDAVVLTVDAQPDFADFVLVPYDMSMNATAPGKAHVYYDAPFADWYVPVFDISLPVFRLCNEYGHNTYSHKSQNCAPANNRRAAARYVRV